MLQLFRKYQKGLFLIVTGMVAISFSFFGTYSAFTERLHEDPVAFVAIDGTEVRRSDFDAFVNFIGTDSTDKVTWGAFRHANFLNDGVIRFDFLETGLASTLVERSLSELQTEMQQRAGRERHFKPYTHPYARFITAQSAWKYFAPELHVAYQSFKGHPNPATKEAIDTRIRLYLAESEFTPMTLAQVIRYQEGQYEGMQPDPELWRRDLSLFHYHGAEDWFGRRFVELVAQFVINAAIVAEQEGIVVTKEETLSHLTESVKSSYAMEKQRGELFGTEGDYFAEHLRHLGMDRTRAVRLWRKVLLFRRLIDTAADKVLVDGLAYDQLLGYAKQSRTIKEYQLPPALELRTPAELHRFETYLDAVAEGYDPMTLDLPSTYRAVDKVRAETPEFVQRIYTLSVASTDMAELRTRVGLKEAWEWQVKDENWKTLQKEFPQLGVATAPDAERRFAVLDSLSPMMRGKVDDFSRAAIVESHPEWIEAALASKPLVAQEYRLRYAGEQFPFKGVADRAAFFTLLDRATLVESEAGVGETVVADPELAALTMDDDHYYRILVHDIGDKRDEVLSFAEASKLGIIDTLFNKKLEAFYQANREKSGDRYRRTSGLWKSFTEVESEVAEEKYAPLYAKIHEEFVRVHGKEGAPENPTAAFAVNHRFDHALTKIRDQIVALSDEKTEFVLEGKLPAHYRTLGEQWKLVKIEGVVERNQLADERVAEKLFSIEEGGWSELLPSEEGTPRFMQIVAYGLQENDAIAKKMDEARALLSLEMQRVRFSELLAEFSEKGAMELVRTQTVEDEAA